MYVAIIFEVAHRTVVTMIASTAAITVLAYLNIRPSLEEIVTWVDVETLVLLELVVAQDDRCRRWTKQQPSVQPLGVVLVAHAHDAHHLVHWA